MNSRQRMLAACRGEPLTRPPVWLMRQAGRYLPEYRALRQRHSFWEVVRTPEVAVEATMQPLRRFPLDAAIVFSDILVVLQAMGAEVGYPSGGPTIERIVDEQRGLAGLRPVDATRDLGFVGAAVRLLCERVHPTQAVIGFAGAPLTLAAYLIEGGGSRDLRHLKALAYRKPDMVAELLERVADVVADLLLLQVEAGADLVQIFDSWAVHLSPDDYRWLALPPLRRVVQRVRAAGRPVIVYLRGAASHLEAAASTGCDLVSVDSSLRLDEARRRLPANVGLQGNLDPAELLGPPARIREQVRALAAQGGPRGYIFNLGQGLVPDLPVEGVAACVQAVVELDAHD